MQMQSQNTALQSWALPRLSKLLPLEEGDLRDIVSYTATLPETDATQHLSGLLGDSPDALQFIATFDEHREKTSPEEGSIRDSKKRADDHEKPGSDAKVATSSSTGGDKPPDYAPPSYGAKARTAGRDHTNQVMEAAKVRARDEQDMQQMLQSVQFQYSIYNSDIEPEHEADYYCSCAIHQYQRMKWDRYGVQKMWSKAVMYPGEKSYNDNNQLFTSNPYTFRVISPYGTGNFQGMPMSRFQFQQRPRPEYHALSIHQTIELNNALNREAQVKIDAEEPKYSVWDDSPLETALAEMKITGADEKRERRHSHVPASTTSDTTKTIKPSRFASVRKSIGMLTKSSEERAVAKVAKAMGKGIELRDAILAEEQGRWPDEEWRHIVALYQQKVGMATKIANLRARCPIQYLHLLRAGYFEPIPVAWAQQASNPLKFSIEAAAGWRGITPAWRGYEDTAEERLYWVLNHREGGQGARRMKPDFISEMEMARARMATAVEPPPLYFAADDTCHLQHTSAGYSKQVMPSPFRAFDRPESPADDTMILLDVSGSMDFEPMRPVYDQYLITGYARSTQPKNKDVARSIIRRFTDAMAHHDHQSSGYDLTTFSSQATYIGTVNHQNLEQMWARVRLGGGTRVMTGWQKVKDLHFRKHSRSATHHPVCGWQAGPDTPVLRLLLLLDGEAADMDEFELDLLGLSWAHVTVFLIGVDGCPHHHRHANELQRISDVNHHVSFVDAQGNCPERFVTHELLKRHLGYDVSMREFEQMEELPAYSVS